MATQPKPQTPAKPPPARAEAEETGLPPPVKTIADEQRERSQAIEAQGVEAFKASYDERDPDEPQRRVPGVGPTTVAAESAPVSTRSTPAARNAQHPTAPR